MSFGTTLPRIFEDAFGWGVCIDNPWTFAGRLPPKSIVIPHVLSLRLPQGPISMNFGRQMKFKKFNRGLSTVSFFDPVESKRREISRMFSRNVAREFQKNKIRFVRIWFQWNLFQKKIARGKIQDYQFPLDDFVETM